MPWCEPRVSALPCLIAVVYPMVSNSVESQAPPVKGSMAPKPLPIEQLQPTTNSEKVSVPALLALATMGSVSASVKRLYQHGVSLMLCIIRTTPMSTVLR